MNISDLTPGTLLHFQTDNSVQAPSFQGRVVSVGVKTALICVEGETFMILKPRPSSKRLAYIAVGDAPQK